jgi:hypothetical protein
MTLAGNEGDFGRNYVIFWAKEIFKTRCSKSFQRRRIFILEWLKRAEENYKS